MYHVHRNDALRYNRAAIFLKGTRRNRYQTRDGSRHNLVVSPSARCRYRGKGGEGEKTRGGSGPWDGSVGENHKVESIYEERANKEEKSKAKEASRCTPAPPAAVNHGLKL